MNIGTFMFNISKALMGLGQKLFDVWNAEVDISWVKSLLNFFGASVNIPDSLSLSWLLTGASAAFLVAIIIYRIFK